MINLVKRIAITLPLVFVSYFFYQGYRSKSITPKLLGVTPDGDIQGCGEKPNCVSSQASSEMHKIGPLNIPDEISFYNVIETLEKMGGEVREKDSSRQYAHLIFTSKIFGFVDDVEILFRERNTVDIRSASRVGYSDLNANRKRVESIRKLVSK